MTMMATIGCRGGFKTNDEELFYAPSSVRRRFRCSRAYSDRIKARRRSKHLLPSGRRLGLAGPLPVLELRTMHGNRIRYPQLL